MSVLDTDSSTFDNLVSGISSDERKVLLDKIKPDAKDEISLHVNDSTADYTELPLSEQMRKLSIFTRIWFWLSAVFTNQSVDVVFNNHLVANIAHRIEHSCPGIIDYKRRLLYTIFYEKLTQLRAAVDFLKPYISSYSANPGGFYVLLCNELVPSLKKDLEEQTDPYQYPFSKEVNNEMRLSLLHRQEQIINDMSSGDKAKAYAAVRFLEWLKNFCELPIHKMISTFTFSSVDEKVSYFKQIGTFFNAFSRVMCSSKPYTEEVLRILYQFDRRKNNGKSLEETESDVGIDEFMEKAVTQMSVIKMFVTTVPVRELSCVIFNNSQFVPEPCGGGEDWFIKYKNQWKTILNYKWDLWQKDAKKEKLKTKLVSYFSMSGFPLFPYRPWAKCEGGLFFHYEMTLGFIYAFFKNEYMFYVPVLKTAAFEGDFSVRENRLEFTDTVNSLNKVNENLDILANSLSASGEYGQVFGMYETEGKSTKSIENSLEKALKSIEKDTLVIINSFGKCCRTMESLMGGMLSDHITAYYGPLNNLDTIKGKDNKKFKEDLLKCKFGLAHAFELVKELEPLDLPVSETDI